MIFITMPTSAAAVPLAVEAAAANTAAVPIRTTSPVDEADDEADAQIRIAPLPDKAAAAAAVPIRTDPPIDEADDKADVSIQTVPSH